MNKKLIVAILVIIILLVIIGFTDLSQFYNSQNQINVGNDTFILPDGFHEGTPKNEYTNITNGYDTIFLKECGADNITKYTKQYIKNKQNNNTSVHMKKFTVNDTLAYKASLDNNPNAVRYWFNYNDKVYTIYSLNANNNTDKIVKDIIRCIN